MNIFFKCVLIALALNVVSIQQADANGYHKSSFVSNRVWKRVKPYLLPDDHPARKGVDKIFSSEERVTLSLATLKKAGFKGAKVRDKTHLIVVRHPRVPGYIFKIYLDSQRFYKGVKEHVLWLERIKGADAIRKMIRKKHMGDLVKVPKKWIVPLSDNPSLPKQMGRKNFVIIEEDMKLYDYETNKRKWASTAYVTKSRLVALYEILEGIGLRDCSKLDNIPFSKDGKIAFIDTQSHGQWAVPYERLTGHLPKSLQKYWKKITKNSRKK